MKYRLYRVTIIIFITFFTSLFSQEIPSNQAQKYFSELKSIADRDNKKMWGEYLYGPLMFVNPRTKQIITNEADKGGTLKYINRVYTGNLSTDDVVANTAYNWHGKLWTMILLPLPKSDYERKVLMVHESFHRIQDKLGLVSPGGTNNQLDEENARILLRLEWNALLDALENSSGKKQYSIQSALVFRSLRRQLYPQSSINENAMEIHEGLAEYTGIRLGIGQESERIQYIASKVKAAGHFTSLVRSFPYESGPLYCLLLDQSNSLWKKSLNAKSDLGLIAKSAYDISLPSNLKQAYDERKYKYGYNEISGYEGNRENERLQAVNEYKSKFVTGRILTIPFINMKIQFDPRNLISLGDYGTVYPTLKIVDEWGSLEVNDGALIPADWKKVIVTYPEKIEGNNLFGDGWQITLKNGWKYLRDDENLIIGR